MTDFLPSGWNWAWLVPIICWGIVAWFAERAANGPLKLWPDDDPAAPSWYREHHHR